MANLETEAELIALHAGNIKESLHLEYKDSRSVDKRDDKKKIEMARDVSAFANAQGGQIVYAMTEANHAPAGLDDGLDPHEYPEIWFEQVLQQHVTPKIEGLDIKHALLASGRVAVVISVPASEGDPHQTSDGKYYRRHSYNRLAMEHYEVRDAFRRVTHPKLYIKFAFVSGERADLRFVSGEEISRDVRLLPIIGNSSNEPVFHTLVQLDFDNDLGIGGLSGPWSPPREIRDAEGRQFKRIIQRISTPPALPIFKDLEQPLDAVGIPLLFHSDTLHGHLRWSIGVKVNCPGFSLAETWVIDQQGSQLRILRPGHPLLR